MGPAPASDGSGCVRSDGVGVDVEGDIVVPTTLDVSRQGHVELLQPGLPVAEVLRVWSPTSSSPSSITSAWPSSISRRQYSRDRCFPMGRARKASSSPSQVISRVRWRSRRMSGIGMRLPSRAFHVLGSSSASCEASQSTSVDAAAGVTENHQAVVLHDGLPAADGHASPRFARNDGLPAHRGWRIADRRMSGDVQRRQAEEPIAPWAVRMEAR
jgi:hypothetical protein